MKKIYIVLCGLILHSGCASAADFAISVKELRAVMDVPVLSSLLNDAAIERIQKVGATDVFEVSSSICVARIRIISDASGMQNPKAEVIGAECGP